MDSLEKQLLSDFEQKCPGAKVLAFFVAGSHFFDLNGPNSDKDYRAVYMPSAQQLKNEKRLAQLFIEHKRLNKHKNSQVNYQAWEPQVNLSTNKDQKRKNTKDDIDCTFYSLDEFLRLLCKWDFNMLELLYAPASKTLIMTEEFKELVDRRDLFFPLDLYSYLGFVNSELELKGLGASSFGKYDQFVNFLKTLPYTDRIYNHWDKLVAWNKESKVGVVTETLIRKQGKTIPAFRIASRTYMSTDQVKTVLGICEAKLANFGHRQKSHAEVGLETKGLSHALRLLYEAKDLIEHKELRLPMPEERLQQIRDIKNGKMGQDETLDLIDTNLEEVRAYDEAKRQEDYMLKEKKKKINDWGEQYFFDKKQQLLLKDMTK